MPFDRTRWMWPIFCAGLLAGTTAGQLLLSEPGGAGPTPVDTPFTHLQEQVDNLAATLSTQRDLLNEKRDTIALLRE